MAQAASGLHFEAKRTVFYKLSWDCGRVLKGRVSVGTVPTTIKVMRFGNLMFYIRITFSQVQKDVKYIPTLIYKKKIAET